MSQQQIPDLVNAQGRFPTELVRAGFRFFLMPGIRKQLEAEIRAQFDAFQKAGLVLDHVNAHNHMHLHPTILKLILKVGREYGLRAIRLPNEPPLRSWRASRNSLGPRFISWIFLRPWIHLMKRMLCKAEIRFNDFIFGMTDSGAMDLHRSLHFLHNLPRGVTEIYFHPATRRCLEIDATMPRYHHEEEYRALTSRVMVQTMQSLDIKAIAFSDL